MKRDGKTLKSEILPGKEEQVLATCARAIGKTDRIKTSSGNVVEGVIVECEPGFIRRTRCYRHQTYNVLLECEVNGVKFTRALTVRDLPA